MRALLPWLVSGNCECLTWLTVSVFRLVRVGPQSSTNEHRLERRLADPLWFTEALIRRARPFRTGELDYSSPWLP